MTDTKDMFTRRRLLMGLAVGATAAATGCTSSPRARIASVNFFPSPRRDSRIDPEYVSAYGPVYDAGYRIPAVDLSRVDPRYYRREVDNPTGEPAGSVVVDVDNFFAYHTMPGGRAMRYGVGVGRAGFAWGGNGVIQWKRKWPTWTPPAEMIARDPKLERFSAANGGMEPGLGNPLGARALYIFQGGQDTLYRLHGSPEYWTIGTNSSSGCIRFMNQDIIDLYGRVKPGSPIVVRQGGIV